MELSGPQVMCYLMNWGDCFISHHYIPVYWAQLGNTLKTIFPSLRHCRRAFTLKEAVETTSENDRNDVSIIIILLKQGNTL
jgi:hypothetical protein